MWGRILLGAALCAAWGAAQESTAMLENPYTSDADVAGGEKTFVSQCASCHGLGAKGGAGGPDLTTGRFRRASSDEGIFNLIGKGIPGTTMPAFLLNAGQVWRLVSYIRFVSRQKSRPAMTGDAARGETLFAANKCGGCHWAGAPNLSAIVNNRSVEELKRAITEPSADVPSGYWRATVTMKTPGVTYTGTRLNEDTFTLQLRERSGFLRTIQKSGAAKIDIDRSSPMPAFAGKLSAAELDDLTAYLVSRSAK